MIVHLKGKDCAVLLPVFQHTTDTCVLTVTQGHMGEAWADDRETPRCGKIVLGDFCFFDGDAELPAARELVEQLPQGTSFHDWTLVGSDDKWNHLIETVWGERAKPFTRYAIQKEGDVFDREKLRTFAENVPESYTIRQIDGELYEQAMKAEWSWDACIQFDSKEDFLKRGLGFAIVFEGKLVAQASSYSIYDQGLEITISTHRDHRRKGLAKACVSTLILACLERDWYPSWDARTLISVALAEQLGYRLDRPYRAYSIETENETK